MADPVAPTLTIEYLKDVELGSKTYMVLTNNNTDAIATAKLEQSRGWAESKFNNIGATFDETDFYTAQAVMQMTVFMLYQRNNQHEAGKPFKSMAEEMLKTALGNAALGGSDTDLPSAPAAYVAEGSTALFADSNGYGGFGPGEDY